MFYNQNILIIILLIINFNKKYFAFKFNSLIIMMILKNKRYFTEKKTYLYLLKFKTKPFL